MADFAQPIPQTFHYLDAAGHGVPAPIMLTPGPAPREAAPAARVETRGGALADQVESAGTASAETNKSTPATLPFHWRDLSATPTSEAAGAPAGTSEQLALSIELGRARMLLADVLALAPGAVVSLDKLAGDLVDICIDGRLVGHGEIVVFDDKYCVRVAELIAAET